MVEVEDEEDNYVVYGRERRKKKEKNIEIFGPDDSNPRLSAES